MAYSTAAPPALQYSTINASIGQSWWYSNGDTDATVKAAGYITNGVGLGMRVGDTVEVWVPSVPSSYKHFVLSVTGQAVNLSQTPSVSA